MNIGHTIGHALEYTGRYSHGISVFVGVLLELIFLKQWRLWQSLLASSLGQDLLKSEEAQKIIAHLTKIELTQLKKIWKH